MKQQARGLRQPEYGMDEQGHFVIENYNQTKPFSNFFPGIAGMWGIPMWVFYVNRGQGISSFGIESKDKAILEFLPANKAYRLTSVVGFRSFLKVTSGGKTILWEPFQDNFCTAYFKTRQRMIITPHDMTIEDHNPSLGLTVRVNYFPIVGEDYPALVRRVTVENISKKKIQVEMVDGLPVILPYGMSDWVVKNMSRTVEAWVKVKQLKKRTPFFHLNVEVNDTPQVKHIHEGHFYFAFDPQARGEKLLEPIVDTTAVFGGATDFISPHAFVEKKNFHVPDVQQTANRTPCAMSFARLSLSPGGKKEIVTAVGYAQNQEQLQGIVKKMVGGKGYVEAKAEENQALISRIQNYALTSSSSDTFDRYAGQAFLDNVMRGGLPVSLKTVDGNVAFNVFSRKHGDPERDYNYFVLSPTYFSQGNGNNRDVNQNRRNDVWFNRDVRDNSIINFLSLVQADGYNPLVVKGLSFKIENPEKVDVVIRDCISGQVPKKVREVMSGYFQPGELLRLIALNEVKLKVSMPEFLSRLLALCHKSELAEHGEGFWTDHWTYNLDLIESYLSVYPEALKSLLIGKKVFSFYHNTHYVLPRSQRFYLTPDGVRQYHSVKLDASLVKMDEKAHKLRVEDGEGEIYYTHLLAKLLCLVANKAATFDPSGIGIEMEADKPNWYDSLNGLPGLLGSSISETLELKRFCLFLKESLAKIALKDDEDVWIMTELATFIKELKECLASESTPAACWHKANDIKEHYRARVRKGIEGGEHALKVREIREFLDAVIARVDYAQKHARDEKGLTATYFYHEVTDYALLDKKHNEWDYVLPVNFKRHNLPLFLEGIVHELRIEGDAARAREIYSQVRKSPLFDKKLKMYKVNASLDKETEEIGRTRIFPAGWLENESIWLHMEYKYCLELLRTGLYDEFYETFKDVLIAFQPPARYGRSPLENSSFLVSSAHEDASLHGQGYVARLSGSTAEFLHLWLWMNVGRKPFVLAANNELQLVLAPILPGWLFSKAEKKVDYFNDREQRWQKITLPKNTYAFNLMSATLVVYHNPRRVNTYGPKRPSGTKITLKFPGKKGLVEINGGVIPAPYATDIRDGKVERIDVSFE